MKIVDQFCFSEPHEATLLYLKLVLEDPIVAEWVVVENTHTFRGEYKGHYLPDILSEPRFAPYRTKLTYIPVDFKPTSLLDLPPGVYDQIAFEADYKQRESSRAHILRRYSPQDYVLLSDVDEMLDGTDPERVAALTRRLGDHPDHLRIPRIRYMYDFDNLWEEERSVPIASVGFLLRSGLQLSHVRYEACGIGPTKPWECAISFEYSCCFPRDAIKRKYNTFQHTGVKDDEVDIAINNNHLPVSSLRGRSLDFSSRWWLRKVRLTPSNSPRFVRDHLPELRTGIVNPDYARIRRTTYPHLFSLRGRLTHLWWPRTRRLVGRLKRLALNRRPEG